MQSLYSYFCISDLKVKEKKDHLFKTHELTSLYYFFINTLLRVSDYSKEFHSLNKKKFFPNEKDLNPNYKFYNNQFLNIFRSANFSKNFKKINEISEKLNTNHDLDKKFFLEIYKTDFYTNYTESSVTTLSSDKDFVINVLKTIFSQFDFYKQLLFEENVFWIDDYDFILVFLINKIKNNEKIDSFKIFSPFKNSDDESFFMFLFEKTIQKNKDFDKIIEENSSNWDIERIAAIDMILIKMGLTELFYLKNLPHRVTLNEYIEISKFYSTKNSSKFINGILDKVLISKKEIHKK